MAHDFLCIVELKCETDTTGKHETKCRRPEKYTESLTKLQWINNAENFTQTGEVKLPICNNEVTTR